MASDDQDLAPTPSEERALTPTRGDFLCESCLSFQERPGLCPRCPDETLLNVQDAQVRQLIAERDQRRYFSRATRYTLIGLAVMVPTHLILALLFNNFIITKALMFFRFALLITMLQIGLFGVSVLWVEKVLMRRFPPVQVMPLITGEPVELPQEDLMERLKDLFDTSR